MKPTLLLVLSLVIGVLLVVTFSAQAPSPSLDLARTPNPAPAAPPSATPKLSFHDRRGVYLTAYAAANPVLLEGILANSARFGLNAVVIDVKNNDGDVCHGSQVPLARALGAVRPLLDLPKLVEELHRRGFYVIAQHVVFYDPRLAKHLGEGGPWVPATSAQAVSYNLALAQEVAASGVDEIQFDYIRFPDDGPIGPDYSARCAAVEAFLIRARQALPIPISVDVYGRVL